MNSKLLQNKGKNLLLATSLLASSGSAFSQCLPFSHKKYDPAACVVEKKPVVSNVETLEDCLDASKRGNISVANCSLRNFSKSIPSDTLEIIGEDGNEVFSKPEYSLEKGTVGERIMGDVNEYGISSGTELYQREGAGVVIPTRLTSTLLDSRFKGNLKADTLTLYTTPEDKVEEPEFSFGNPDTTYVVSLRNDDALNFPSFYDSDSGKIIDVDGYDRHIVARTEESNVLRSKNDLAMEILKDGYNRNIEYPLSGRILARAEGEEHGYSLFDKELVLSTDLTENISDESCLNTDNYCMTFTKEEAVRAGFAFGGKTAAIDYLIDEAKNNSVYTTASLSDISVRTALDRTLNDFGGLGGWLLPLHSKSAYDTSGTGSRSSDLIETKEIKALESCLYLPVNEAVRCGYDAGYGVVSGIDPAVMRDVNGGIN